MLERFFIKTKDRPSEWQVKGIVYKVKCKSCPLSVNQKDLGIPGTVNTSPAHAAKIIQR